MKMRLQLFIVVIALMTAVGQVRNAETNEASTYAFALHHLASERFAENLNRGEVWIISLTETVGSEVRKFSDGKFTVVLIPVRPFEREGICLYAGHYHDRNLALAARWCREGKLTEARTLFRLMLKYSCEGETQGLCHSGIQMLDEISKGNPSDKLVDEFESSLKKHAGSSAGTLDKLNQTRPVSTNDLFNLPITK